MDILSFYQGWAQGKKKNPEVKIEGDHSAGSGVLRPPEAEENTTFFTLKMQFQGLLTHKLLGPPINATPKLLPKLQRYKFMTPSDTGLKLKKIQYFSGPFIPWIARPLHKCYPQITTKVVKL